MYPHRIRLRGPWQYEPLARLGGESTALPPAGIMKLPCTWSEGGLADFAGRVRFRRRFQWLGRLDAHERIWLTFQDVAGAAEVWLNDRQLGKLADADRSFEFDVTGLLQARNQLIVDVESAKTDGGLRGEVALEVRCMACLRAVQCALVEKDGKRFLEATGEVAGSADQPLELYVLLDGKTVGYTTVEATVPGRTFRLVSDELPASAGGTHTVRVELVNAATVWYGLEQSVSFTRPPEAGG